jgi:hypothetical protein
MKYLIIVLLAVTTYKAILKDGQEILIYCEKNEKEEYCTQIEQEACWDPVLKKWEPCY